MTKKDMSCIILTCDSYVYKGGCVEHTLFCVLNQIDVSIEIIIVDNSHLNESYENLKLFLQGFQNDITIVRTQCSIAAARNFGAKAATTGIFVFLDDDALLINNNSLRYVKDLSISNQHGYGGLRYWTKSLQWFLSNKEQLLNDFEIEQFDFLRDNIGEPDISSRKTNTSKYLKRTFIGNFGYVTRQLFEKTGGFPETFTGYGLEDDAFSFLCFLYDHYPASLMNIETVHITHNISNKCFDELNNNRALYNKLLNLYGYNKFNIGDLLYPELTSNRSVLE